MTDLQLTLTEATLKALLAGDTQQTIQTLHQQLLQQLLEAEMDEHLSATKAQRTDSRTGYRNGHYKRTLTTRVGTMTLLVPRTRDGSFSTELFERYSRSEKALVAAMIDMVVQGVSTRKVAAITEELCGRVFSKSTISRYTQQIDEAVEAWRTRRLDEQAWPFVQLDAMFIKVREDGHVRSMALMIAIGIGEDGVRRILGCQLGHTENGEHWSSFLSSLLERGLSGVDVVTSDAHEGLVSAIQRKLPNALWQRCQAHFRRNVIDAAPKRYKEVLHKGLDRILLAEGPVQARNEVMLLIEELDGKCDKALTCLEDGWEDACAVLGLPEKYRKRLRTTNMLERLNGELRRRDRVIRIYPNQASAIRLMSAQLIEQDENWSTQKCYMTMEAYFVWVQAQDDKDLAALMAAAE